MKTTKLKMLICGIAILLVAFFCIRAYQQEFKVQGRVTEVIADGSFPLYIVEQENGKQTAVSLQGIFVDLSGLPDEYGQEDLRNGKYLPMDITAWCRRPKITVTTSDGRKIDAYPTEFVYQDSLTVENALTLSDGTPLHMTYDFMDSRIYSPPDGTELVYQHRALDPDEIREGALDRPVELSDGAFANICGCIADKGILYDLPSALEQAYGEYRSASPDKAFAHLTIGQETYAVNCDEHITTYFTSVTHPVSGQTCWEEQYMDVFDTETGEHISNYDLFNCPPEEIFEKLTPLLQISDDHLLQEMSAAFREECILLYPYGLKLYFPRGSLPSQEHSFIVSIEPSEQLQSLLQPWVVFS